MTAKTAGIASEPEALTRIGTLKNMLLFLSAPFVGLVYAVLLPFVGLFLLARAGGKALARQPAVRDALGYGKFLLKMAALPWVALGGLIAFPFLAIGMVSWIGVKAAAASR